MKTLTLLILLFASSNLFALDSLYLAKSFAFDKPFEIMHPTGRETPKIAIYAIIFESAVLLSSSYFIRQGNHEAYRASRWVFIGSTVPLVAITFGKKKPKRHW